MKNIYQILYLLMAITACTSNVNNDEVAENNNQSVLVSSDYTEPHRPQFHFSPDSMWMNDPNGMVFHNGEYHLFYQYYPDSTVWGPMHWGHAVSEDLVHWEHLPIALYPDSLGYIFSGSAVVDWNNTSGFGSEDDPAIVAIYTYHLVEGEKAGRNDYQTQGIAYSLDDGRTWEKYEGNPVLENPGIKDFRDPKVFWHDDTKKWVMILAVKDHVSFYGSKDLKQWDKLSEFGKNMGGQDGVWECPDLFELPVEGSNESKWVMIVSLGDGAPNKGSGTQYFIGDFDGEKFTSDNPPEKILWLDYGRDNYAGVTWSDIPESDGRRIFIGWMSNWKYAIKVPTSSWRSAMTVPRTLSLKQTDQGVRLISQPVKELQAIRESSFDIENQSISGELDLSGEVPFKITTSELILEFDAINANDFGIELSNQKGQKLLIGYETDQNRFYIDRSEAGKKDFDPGFSGVHYAPRALDSNTLKLHLLLDVSSVEIFADDGLVVMTDLFFPEEDYDQLKLYSKEGTVGLTSGKIHELQSIWNGKMEL